MKTFLIVLWTMIWGSVSPILLMLSWAFFISIFFGIIGAIRKRCPFYAFLMYLAGGIITGLLYRGGFIISSYLDPQGVTKTPFMVIFIIWLIISICAGVGLLREVWKVTNSRDFKNL